VPIHDSDWKSLNVFVTAQTTLTFPFSLDEGCDDKFSPFAVRLHALSLRVPWIPKSCLRGVYVQSIGVDEIAGRGGGRGFFPKRVVE
jgi:hypothetical protein